MIEKDREKMERKETGTIEKIDMSNKIQKYEDLDVWKESMRLVSSIYSELKTSKYYGLKSQIQRSAVSIPSNITEGYERGSNKEYIHFLYIAKASCGELRTQLYIAKSVDEIGKNIADKYIERTKKISAMLYKLIKIRKERF